MDIRKEVGEKGEVGRGGWEEGEKEGKMEGGM